MPCLSSVSGGIRVKIPQEFDLLAFWPWNLDVVVFLSRGIRVRIPKELDVVAFWPWHLDVAVSQSWNLDVVAFFPLKKRLGITIT